VEKKQKHVEKKQKLVEKIKNSREGQENIQKNILKKLSISKTETKIILSIPFYNRLDNFIY